MYNNAKSAQEVAEYIKVKFGVIVSKRSIQTWAKDSQIAKAAGGEASLFIEQSINIHTLAPATGQKFDIQEFVEKNKMFFEESNQRLDAIIKKLYESITSEEIVRMPIKDRLIALSRLEKLKIGKYNFLLSVIARSADDEDDLKTLVSALTTSLNGGPMESPEPEEEPHTIEAEVV